MNGNRPAAAVGGPDRSRSGATTTAARSPKPAPPTLLGVWLLFGPNGLLVQAFFVDNDQVAGDAEDAARRIGGVLVPVYGARDHRTPPGVS